MNHYTGRWTLDERALLAAVERQRAAEGYTWADVSAETGLAPPTFTRFTGGRGLSVNTYTTLVAWLGITPPFAVRVTMR